MKDRISDYGIICPVCHDKLVLTPGDEVACVLDCCQRRRPSSYHREQLAGRRIVPPKNQVREFGKAAKAWHASYGGTLPPPIKELPDGH